MGKPLMIREEDDAQIERLKTHMHLKKKIDVVRTALGLLEEHLQRQERIKRWEKAAKLVGASGLETLKDFQTPSRFKKLP